MRPIILLAVLLVLLLPVSITASTVQTPTAQTSQAVPSLPEVSSVVSGNAETGVISSGQTIVLRSFFGIAIYNVNGKFVIVPAWLVLNMTVRFTNSTGIGFSVDSGRVTVGYPTLCPSQYCGQRIFDVTGGQAFLTTNGPAYYGLLTIQAKAVEEVTNAGFYLFLKGPARLVSPIVSQTNAGFFLYARLYGALYNSTEKIGLLFLVGSGVCWGDANMDGSVSIVDMVSIGGSFVSGYGDANYNPYADLNMDGKVDLMDLVITGGSFGSTY